MQTVHTPGPAAAPAVVAAPVCPLFLAPESGAERVDELLLGMEAEVPEAPRPGWVRVITQYRYSGYARREGLLLGSDARSWAPLPKAVVWKSFCDLLARPDVRAPVLLTLPRGALVAPAGEEEGGWQPVRLPGDGTGFVRGEALAPWPPKHRQGPALRDELIRTARRYLGAPYRWGGKTPSGIDCSGLVSMTYRLNGIAVCRDARLEPGFPVREIPFSRLGRGDLLYFPGHVALYLGARRYIHATAAGGGVVLGCLDPGGPGYRADLAGRITACGSVF